MLGVCPSNAILLRQTIHWHLRRSRPQEILNRIAENTLPVSWNLRPRICQLLLCLATKDYSDRLLADFFNILLECRSHDVDTA